MYYKCFYMLLLPFGIHQPIVIYYNTYSFTYKQYGIYCVLPACPCFVSKQTIFCYLGIYFIGSTYYVYIGVRIKM